MPLLVGPVLLAMPLFTDPAPLLVMSLFAELLLLGCRGPQLGCTDAGMLFGGCRNSSVSLVDKKV